MKFPFRSRNRDANDAADERDTIDGERSVASVNKGLGVQTKITNIVIGAAVILLVGFMLFKYYAALYDKRKEAQAASQKDANHSIATNLPPLTPPAFNDPSTPAPAPTTPPPPMNTAANGPAVGSDGKPVLTPAQVNLNRRLGSGVFFKVDSSSGGAGGTGAAVASANGSGGSGSARPSGQGGDSLGGGGGDPLSKSLQASRFSDAKAYLLPDPSLMVTMGAGIPCTVLPAIDTTLPGIVTCIQKEDVYSADHKVLLLERGTKWVGQQKFGMAQGQRRVGILWTRGETPNHVLIDVDSAAGDALGRPGIDGVVDNHFWDRFGAAIMLSLISDVGTYLAATQQNSGSGSNNTTIAFPNTVQGSQSVMSDVLKTTLNIPPTLTKNQGADIMIYVARDLDFRDVYDVQVKK
ncbi:Protein virB10 [Paraburkholderia aspalathi]|uniref:type IV secretion system protein VirB10 n=1 Tax=Paraburkholderia aspalathi TaxID=1324617 RepID=UPI001B0857E6|nr:type IV secretion system protein VirB10 [Paraburkholderia aspalathi]CAE6850484.1 Protein virB10 [Paraburkholderia aspalathi]